MILHYHSGVVSKEFIVRLIILVTFGFILLVKLPPCFESTIAEEPSQSANKNLNNFQEFSFKNAKDSKSLRHCKDIFEITDVGVKKENYPEGDYRGIARQVIFKAKVGKDFLHSEAYEYLASLVPAMVKEVAENGNKTKLIYKKESRLSQLNYRIPYLPCQLHQYYVRNVSECVKKRYEQGKQTRIAFLGDSRVRMQMELLLDYFRSIRPIITTETGVVLTVDQLLSKKMSNNWRKYKSKLTATFEDVPNFFLQFYWAPFIHRGDAEKDITPRSLKIENYYSILLNQFPYLKNGLDIVTTVKPKVTLNKNQSEESKVMPIVGKRNGPLDEIQRWLSGSIKNMPDIVVIDTGPWQMIESIGLNVLDWYAVDGLKMAYSMLKKLARKTRVVMMMSEPYKEYVVNSGSKRIHFNSQRNEILQWFQTAQANLVPDEVIFWDSFLPFAQAGIDDCFRIAGQHGKRQDPPGRGSFDATDWWGCGDRMHLGYEILQVAMQMLLNELCNGFVGGGSACCDTVS